MANCKLLLNDGSRILLNDNSYLLLNDDSCYPEGGRKFKVRSPVRLQTQQILVSKTKPFVIRSRLYNEEEAYLRIKSKLLSRQKIAITIQSRLKHVLIDSLRIKSKLTARTILDSAITSKLSLPLNYTLILKGIKDYSKVDRLLTLLGLLE